jgi:hypothetical protein
VHSGGTVRHQDQGGVAGLAPLQPGAETVASRLEATRIEKAHQSPTTLRAQQTGGSAADRKDQWSVAGRR